jgi:redox-sensitive bicupin YhaK (pirin superfamily)
VHFLQIWIVPDRRGVAPRYQQVHFSDESKRGRLRLIISPEGQDGSLGVYQDVRVYAGLFDGAEYDALDLPQGRHAYVHVARGSVSVNGLAMEEGDGARMRAEPRLVVESGKNAELLVFSLRHHDVPNMPR